MTRIIIEDTAMPNPYLPNKESEQLDKLHRKIKEKDDIRGILDDINPKYLDVILNNPFRVDHNFIMTPANLAVKVDNLEALKALVAKGAKLDIKAHLLNSISDEYQDNLFLAVVNDRGNILEYLIKEKKIPLDQNYLNELLYSCFEGNYTESAEKLILLGVGADTNYKVQKDISLKFKLPIGETLLQVAFKGFLESKKWMDTRSGYERVFKALLAQGVKQELESPDIKKELLHYLENRYNKLGDIPRYFEDKNIRSLVKKMIDANYQPTNTNTEQPTVSVSGMYKPKKELRDITAPASLPASPTLSR